STRMAPPSTATLTPAGITAGFLPIRDIVHLVMNRLGGGGRKPRRRPSRRLPKFAENFAAELPLPRFAIADHAAAGAENLDALAVEHRLQLAEGAVDPAAGRADALHETDH